MKKVFALFAALVLALAVAGCAPKTEYDDDQLLKIEYIGADGMGIATVAYHRIFDFVKNTVSDVTTIDEDELEFMIEGYRQSGRDENAIAELIQSYNNPKTVATFTDEQEGTFISHVRNAGIYAWKDSYKTNEVICDGAGFSLELSFSDGTVKRTIFYFKYPRNLKKIQAYFLSDLGANMYYGK